MSRHNASRAYQIQDLVKQVSEATPDDLWTLHNIDVDEEGSIFDMCYGKRFDSFHDWAVFNIDMEGLDDDNFAQYGALSDD